MRESTNILIQALELEDKAYKFDTDSDIDKRVRKECREFIRTNGTAYPNPYGHGTPKGLIWSDEACKINFPMLARQAH